MIASEKKLLTIVDNILLVDQNDESECDEEKESAHK